MIESSIVLYNDEVVAIDTGGPVSVEFDFDKIWDFFKNKKSKGLWKPQYLRFYHVHPQGFLNYSLTDLNCVRGFQLAFGHCLNFNIITFNNSNLSDLSHNRICFDYDKTSKSMLFNEEDYLNKLDDKHLFMLKALSYGYVKLGIER